MSEKSGRIPKPTYLRRLVKKGLAQKAQEESVRQAEMITEKQLEEAREQRRYEVFLRWSKTELRRIKKYLPEKIKASAEAGESSFGVVISDVETFPSKVTYYRLSAEDINLLEKRYEDAGYTTCLDECNGLLILKWDMHQMHPGPNLPSPTDRELAKLDTLHWSKRK